MINVRRETMPETIEIDSTSPVPAYYQLYEALRSQLGSDSLPAGTRLATERAMAQEWGVSRQTVRQALARLEREGRVFRRQGDGTYVSEPRVDSRLESIGGFTSELSARGMRVRSQVLDLRLTAASVSVARDLDLPAPGTLVVALRRVRYLDGIPAALETVWMPQEVGGVLLQVDMSDRSLYATLAELAGIVPAAAAETLSATVLDDFEAGELEQRPGDPAFVVERVTRDEQGRRFEAVKSILRADRFSFKVSLDYVSAHSTGVAIAPHSAPSTRHGGE